MVMRSFHYCRVPTHRMGDSFLMMFAFFSTRFLSYIEFIDSTGLNYIMFAHNKVSFVNKFTILLLQTNRQSGYPRCTPNIHNALRSLSNILFMKFNCDASVFICKINQIHIWIYKRSYRKIPVFLKISRYTSRTKIEPVSRELNPSWDHRSLWGVSNFCNSGNPPPLNPPKVKFFIYCAILMKFETQHIHVNK